MVDAADSKSAFLYRKWGFESLPGHQYILSGNRFYTDWYDFRDAQAGGYIKSELLWNNRSSTHTNI